MIYGVCQKFVPKNCHCEELATKQSFGQPEKLLRLFTPRNDSGGLKIIVNYLWETTLAKSIGTYFAGC